MRLLLDTHIALWAATNDPRLPGRARRLIADDGNICVISVVTIWEIAIKHALKPLDMPLSPARALELFESATVPVLPVLPGHAVAVGALPRHHADPFDRMLVAQALMEPLKLLTGDRKLADYGDMILLV